MGAVAVRPGDLIAGGEGRESVRSFDGDLAEVVARGSDPVTEQNVPVDVTIVPGWRALKCEGPLDFSLTGIVASLAEPLADAGVAIFPIATHDTDYLLIKEPQLDVAIEALTSYGHAVRIQPA